MWREGNVRLTPSRAECAGVHSKMPPPLLTRILHFLIYQTGRCLLTFYDCHIYTYKRLVEAISKLSRKQRSLMLQTAAILYMHTITGSFTLFDYITLFLAQFLHSPGYYSHKCLLCLQQWLFLNLSRILFQFLFIFLLLLWIEILALINIISLGKGGKIGRGLFSLEWCAQVLSAEHRKLQRLYM